MLYFHDYFMLKLLIFYSQNFHFCLSVMYSNRQKKLANIRRKNIFVCLQLVFEQVQPITVTLGLHIFFGNKTQSRAVNAVMQTAAIFWTVVEDVT